MRRFAEILFIFCISVPSKALSIEAYSDNRLFFCEGGLLVTHIGLRRDPENDVFVPTYLGSGYAIYMILPGGVLTYARSSGSTDESNDKVIGTYSINMSWVDRLSSFTGYFINSNQKYKIVIWRRTPESAEKLQDTECTMIDK